MAKIRNLSQDEILEFIAGTLNNDDLREILRFLRDKERYECRISGSKDELIDELESLAASQSELIRAIQSTTDIDVNDDESLFDESEDYDEDDEEDSDTLGADDTKADMLLFLEDEPKTTIVDVIRFINEKTDYQFKIKLSGSTADLLAELKDVPKRFIWQAIDSILPSADEDESYSWTDSGANMGSRKLSSTELENLSATFYRKTEETFREYQDEATKKVISFLNGRAGCATLHIATGGGKTKVTNDAISAILSSDPNAKILWVTKSWILLRQAASDLYSRHGFIHQMYRLGGDGSHLGNLTSFFGPGRIVYSTIHTLKNRLDSFMQEYAPTHIIIDENHWGHRRPMYDELVKAVANQCPILGLTATPKSDSKWPILYSKSLAELTPKWLAPFKVPDTQPTTDFRWSPKLRNHMVTQDSYRTLNNPSRNRVIAEYYAQNPDFKKTLVFAVDIQHCKDLCKAFNERGIPAKFIHSEQSHSKNTENIRAFRSKEFGGLDEIKVLINVEMLTMGVDIPEINTIFLARPTESRILFAQMIGRGVRYVSGKEYCNLIEFEDIIEQHKDEFFSARQMFDENLAARYASQTEEPSTPRQPRSGSLFRKTTVYDPAAEIIIRAVTLADGKTLRLPFKARQTFGFEFELTCDDYQKYLDDEELWTEKANQILNVLRKAIEQKGVRHQVVSEPDTYDKYDKWNVVRDGSCGWEIVSPKLTPENGGVNDLNDILLSLINLGFPQNLGLKVNYRTGMHLHLGFCLPEVEELKTLIKHIRHLEPFVALLVAPSRFSEFKSDGTYNLDHPNEFCVSWSQAVDEKWINQVASLRAFKYKINQFTPPHSAGDSAKYMTVNFSNVADENAIPTIEIRAHSGTLDPSKVISWLSLWSLFIDTLRVTELDSSAVKKEKYLPIPSQEHRDNFARVIGHFLGSPERDLMELLDKRASTIWEQWAIAKKQMPKRAADNDRLPKSSGELSSAPTEESKITEFRNLNASEQSYVAAMIRDTNNLKIGSEQLLKKMSRSLTLVVKKGDRWSVVSLKDQSEKLLEAIKKEAALHPPVDSRAFDLFMSNVVANKAREWGYAYNGINDSSVWISLNQTLKRKAEEHGFGAFNLFASCASNNDQGRIYLERQGFEQLMEIESPFTPNTKLIIMIDKGASHGFNNKKAS